MKQLVSNHAYCHWIFIKCVATTANKRDKQQKEHHTHIWVRTMTAVLAVLAFSKGCRFASLPSLDCGEENQKLAILAGEVSEASMQNYCE